MSKAFVGICLAFSVISVQRANCQTAPTEVVDTIDTTQQSIVATIKPVVDFDNIPPRFSYKKIIVPTVLIAYGVATLKSGGLQNVNKGIREELWGERPHDLVHLDNYLQWSPAVAVYGLNLIGIKGKNNFVDRTMIYGISQAIMASTVFATKSLGAETRPDGSDDHSFPSGHTANAFAAAEFLRKEYKDVSPWYGVAGYAVAASTGFLRMYNNRHWLSDVAAGAGIGILSTDLAYLLYPKLKKMFAKKKDPTKVTMVSPFYQQGAVGLSFVRNF